ncbi:MAG: hypothetical protein LWW87_10320 [Geobacteraceae bacterium]|nr:hypothetical protein [Geobacteraceae bacterium]
MQSPLSALCDVLIQMKEAARIHAVSLKNNETLTRVVLIDPVISALGWDISNPHMVEVEKHVGSDGNKPKFLDYLLKGEHTIVIEAKKMGELGDRLEGYFEQILLYASRTGAKSLFLTDGLKWVHYEDVGASNKTPKKIIDLAKTEDMDLPREAVYLIEHLDAAIFSPSQPQESNVVSDLWQRVNELEKTIAEITRQSKNGIHPIITQQVIDQITPWLQLGDNSWDPKSRRPNQLKLPNGQTLDVNGKWARVLTEICRYCLTEKPELLDQLPISDKAGRNTQLIANEAISGNCTQIDINNSTVYVNVLYSANASVANAVYMLAKLGSRSTVNASVLLAD